MSTPGENSTVRRIKIPPLLTPQSRFSAAADGAEPSAGLDRREELHYPENFTITTQSATLVKAATEAVLIVRDTDDV